MPTGTGAILASMYRLISLIRKIVKAEFGETVKCVNPRKERQKSRRNLLAPSFAWSNLGSQHVSF